MWPFRKKPEPPRDCRVWNDDWKVGDTAECVAEAGEWVSSWKPWRIVPKGQRFTVTGFSEKQGLNEDGTLALVYCLQFAETKTLYPTQAFRKVRPVASEDSEIVKRILSAKPGLDKSRTPSFDTTGRV